VLAPGRPNRQVQFIDVRDLSSWTVHMVERQATGLFNATGPKEPLTMLSFLEQANEALGGNATFTWVDDEFLAKQNVRPWTELPLWIPDSGPFVEQRGHMGGMLALNVDKAVEAGLIFRPIAETVQDILKWSQTREGTERKAGMTAEREAEVLAAYHVRRS
jgi:2'-hydroxyisoflavone reductase